MTAIQEVNDSLVIVKRDAEKFAEVKKQAELEKIDYGYNQERYNQGIISKLDLVQVKENLLMMVVEFFVLLEEIFLQII